MYHLKYKLCAKKLNICFKTVEHQICASAGNVPKRTNYDKMELYYLQTELKAIMKQLQCLFNTIISIRHMPMLIIVVTQSQWKKQILTFN